MNRKLYVGGLPYETTEEQLQQLFQEHGTVVSVKIIIDPVSQRSKGFGFVEMETEEQAKGAMDAMQDAELGGRTLKVQDARPQRPRNNFSNNRGGGNSYNRRNNNNNNRRSW